MHIWYMFDNHTFERVKEVDREGIRDHVLRLLEEDSCGSLFVRDEMGGTLDNLTLHTEQLQPGHFKYGILPDRLERWLDELMAERSFRTLMA
jgi:hypothetical protein